MYYTTIQEKREHYGVEYQTGSEHFQYISISSLNTITESQRDLEEVLFKYDLKLKEMVDYKL